MGSPKITDTFWDPIIGSILVQVLYRGPRLTETTVSFTFRGSGRPSAGCRAGEELRESSCKKLVKIVVTFSSRPRPQMKIVYVRKWPILAACLLVVTSCQHSAWHHDPWLVLGCLPGVLLLSSASAAPWLLIWLRPSPSAADAVGFESFRFGPSSNEVHLRRIQSCYRTFSFDSAPSPTKALCVKTLDPKPRGQQDAAMALAIQKPEY